MITGVRDVYYNVQDMNRAVGFYRDVLGVRVVDESPHWASLDIGGVRVGLHWTGGGPVPRIPRDEHGAHAGATVTLEVRDVDAVAAAMKARGVNVLGPVTHNPWGSLAVFEDPDGNVLKLMQPPGKSS
jgi:predicted enzyme related to lactoylglutathione lyase